VIDWKPRAEALAAALADAGAVWDPVWRAAFATTPRHVFVPRFYARDQYGQPRTLVDGSDPAQRETWLESVYRDEVLVTRYRVVDGATMPDGQEVRVATSSASMPGIVATMLDRLQVHDGHRVLEIGTGTGYHAALLCARLGDEQVTSVEVDEATAAEAARQLAAAGHRPTLAAGDGAAGHPNGAPYDRIIATCAVTHIPTAWIDQLTDAGVIVAPLTIQGGLAVLRKTGPGQVSGRLDKQQAYFMTMRPADPTSGESATTVPRFDGPVWHTTTSVSADLWQDPDFRLWLDLHRPDGRIAERVDDQGGRVGVIIYTGGGARAEVDYQRDRDGVWAVRQDAARLWDSVEAAWQSWQRYGQPDRTRIGITARADGEQFAWLDDPDGPLRWPLPGR
jgi:protein-L-isoaspartate(D-aspartate) O-methyltransferase